MLLLLVLALPALAQVESLDDEFNDAATLSDWTSISDAEGWNAEHLEQVDVNTTHSGRLFMMPYTSTWYQDFKGVLLFKTVSGDFTVTTQVTATNRAGTGHPSQDFSLAGLMLRPPRSFTNGADGWTAGNENYVFHAAGTANGTPPQLEIKTTINSSSNLQVSSIGTLTDLQLRVARLGDYLICLAREPGGTWEVRQRLSRPDFPETIQTGFTTYTNYSKASSYTPVFQNGHVLNSSLSPDPSTSNADFNPDLIGSFDFARFTRVDLPANLEGVDLTTSAVSDADLLSFLGFESLPAGQGTQEETQPDQHALPSISAPFPNPTTGPARFTLRLPETEWVHVEVRDLTGRVVASIEPLLLPADQLQTIELPSQNLSSGLFLVVVRAGSFRLSKPLVRLSATL